MLWEREMDYRRELIDMLRTKDEWLHEEVALIKKKAQTH